MPKKGSKSGGKASRVSGGLPTVLLAIMFFLMIIAGLYVYDRYIKPGQPLSIPPVTTQPQAPQTAKPGVTPGKLTGQVVDYYTASGLGSAKVDVIDPGDFSKAKEVITADSSGLWVSSGAVFYSPAEHYKLHVYKSGYYDEIVDITVPSNPALISNEYRYSVGQQKLIARVAADSVTFRLLDPTGATLSSGDGDTVGSQGSYTATATTFNLKVSISLSAYKVSFAKEMPYVKPTTYEVVPLKGIIWVAFNNTAISTSKLVDAGWTPVSTTAFTGWVAFYKVIPEVRSTDTALGTYTVDIPIDTSSVGSSKNVLVYVWIADLQLEENARAFVGTSSLSAYGAVSGYGVTSPLGKVPTVSSGAPASPLLQAKIVTA